MVHSSVSGVSTLLTHNPFGWPKLAIIKLISRRIIQIRGYGRARFADFRIFVRSSKAFQNQIPEQFTNSRD